MKSPHRRPQETEEADDGAVDMPSLCVGAGLGDLYNVHVRYYLRHLLKGEDRNEHPTAAGVKCTPSEDAAMVRSSVEVSMMDDMDAGVEDPEIAASASASATSSVAGLSASKSDQTSSTADSSGCHQNNQPKLSFTQRFASSVAAESIGDKVDSSISTFFSLIGSIVSSHPKLTIILAILITAGCSIIGFMKLSPESRPEKLWYPQNSLGQYAEAKFLSFFPPTSRIQHVVVSNNVAAAAGDGHGGGYHNALTKENLIAAMKMHQYIQNDVSTYNGVDYTFPDLCTSALGSCTSFFDSNPVCSCLVISILKVWSYDLGRLEEDDDYMATLNTYGSNEEDYESVLGQPEFDSSGTLVGAEAFTLTYFLEDQSYVENGMSKDPINMEWEKTVFLRNAQAAQEENEGLDLAYFSTRSFYDESYGDTVEDLIYGR